MTPDKAETGPTTGNPDTGKKWTQIAAVFAVIPEAAADAGEIYDARDLYYQVRPRIQQLGIEELDGKYFAQNLLVKYEQQHGELEGLYRESRGELYHPHDGTVVKLGTRELDAYQVPDYEFDKVLVIEKSGQGEQLRRADVGQRYDMAIISSKGYGVEALRKLLARIEFRDKQIFTASDADLYGYRIARTLWTPTSRMPNHHIDGVITLGLTVPQAIEMSLPPETYLRTDELPNTTVAVLDDDALRWFTGEQVLDEVTGEPALMKVKRGRKEVEVPYWRCTRVELNALTRREGGIVRFVEEELAGHGVVPKLVPPADVVTAEAESDLRNRLHGLVIQVADIDGVVDDLVVRGGFTQVTPDDLRGWLDDNKTLHWSDGTYSLVRADVQSQRAALIPVIRTLLSGASPR